MTTTADTTMEPDGRSRTNDRRIEKRRQARKNTLLFSLFVLPNVAILTVFSYWPNIESFYLSLHSWDFLSPKPIWVGLQNYKDIFTNPDFGQVMINSFLYAASSVVFPMILGLAFALVFTSKIRFVAVGRVLSFVPHIVTGSAIATLWLFMFNPQFGLIRGFLNLFGMSSPDWTGDPNWSLWSIIIVHAWSKIGFVAIVYSAAISGLPGDLYEAARIDGASAWARFRRITLPLLSPITLFLVIIETLHSFQAYEVTRIITNGGPGQSSTTLTWYIYQTAFRQYDVGHSTAAAVLLFFLLVAITGAQFYFSRKRVHYQ